MKKNESNINSQNSEENQEKNIDWEKRKDKIKKNNQTNNQEKKNYQKELEKILGRLEQEQQDTPPKLLLHSCCAPCSSYVLEYLSNYFRITVFYFNPNISPKEEFEKRVEEQKRLIKELNTKYPIHIIVGRYDSQEFFKAVRGYEQEREGGERCIRCYKLRLEETAKIADELEFDYFTTTLTISPLKNAQKLNEIGILLQENKKANYLLSDFKKKGGYQRSVELSKEHELYRQNYCGCIFSARQARIEAKTSKEHQEIND